MSGMIGHIGIGKETTWGIAVAATDYIEALNESIVGTIDRFETRNIIGGLHEPDDSAGVQHYEGAVVFPAHPENVGHALNGVLGVNSITQVLSGFLHTNDFTFKKTLGNSLHPLDPYTIEVYRPGATDISSAFQYAGVQFTSVELNLAPNQDLRVTANVIAKDQVPIVKTSPSFPSSPVAMLDFTTASLQLGAAAVARIEALTVTLDNQLEAIPTLNNSTVIARIRRSGAQMVRISGTVEFEDFTDYDAFKAQTEQRLVASVTRADSFALVVDVPRAVFSEYPVQIPGRERLTVDFAMIGRFHTGSANAVKVSLTTVNTF